MNLRINHIAFVENYLTNVLDESVHAKRIRSLADATIGVILYLVIICDFLKVWKRWESRESRAALCVV